VKSLFKRAFCAALMLSVAPGLASAAPDTDPAIAAGLAIPIERPAARAADLAEHGRVLLVDAASARLFMIEDGRVRDSMRVIVGKPSAATPELKSALRFATLNPYWHVPHDLARKIIAPRVLADGYGYLRARGYEVVSDFAAEDQQVLSPDSIDWKAVAAGRETVNVRQRPGPANSMGQIKFSLETGRGIFLHDTPKKELFAEDDRNLSNGCVRLEDAQRLARWLLGDAPELSSSAPEQHVPLPAPVPVIITYLDDSTPDATLASLLDGKEFAGTD
jgi:L,D-transpeptidase YcbB